ncbi:MAG: formate dehydrogenase accessory sulfurtransferase FdhD [Candidatus Hermodarchaeota archaeon]
MFKRPIKISRISKSKIEKLQDVVLIEKPIDLIVNSNPLVNIICLPKDLEELAMGFLYSIGLINSIEDIKNLEVDEVNFQINIDLEENINLELLKIDPISRIVDTTCGISSPWREIIKKSIEKSEDSIKSKDDFRIKSEVIFSSTKLIQKEMKLYRETGGCHGAAIFDMKGNLLAIKEDIGRHNAIDKVIGDLLLKKHNFERIFLVSSGRLTGDSVLKAIRAKIPVIASVSAAIESGIRLAFVYGITLIGFVRGSRMNIYTHPKRILI